MFLHSSIQPDMEFPRVYPILDVDSLSAGGEEAKLLQLICARAVALVNAGCRMLQYRAKRLNAREFLAQTRELRRLLPGITLIMESRADLCLAAGFDGVHLDQEDLSPLGVRQVLGSKGIIGVSTYNTIQMTKALAEPIDYVMAGRTHVPEARRLRDESGRAKAVVAFTEFNADALLKAGADSVVVMADVFVQPANRLGNSPI